MELKPHTVEAFERYTAATEARIEEQTHSSEFLWVDRSPERLRRVRQGELIAEPWSGKPDTEVPDGTIHDWIGAVFVPGAALERTVAFAQDYNNHRNTFKPEVQDSRILSRRGNEFRVYLRLQRKQILTVVLNTEHNVSYFPLEGGRCYSLSRSARIAEVENAGSSGERELPIGQDHGFLWRLNSYWRFQERDGGVYVECEALSLTRNVPLGLGWIVNPIVRTLPKESLENTLRRMRG